ncbi:DoxX family protein [Archangium primigenium]|uniref:DoxX family protein n=1 Tax=[Archangium] primigenium TaxID=2792470 RepID=UPI00195AB2FB|nr:DoxX family protein [Archangium primigenium]MBM7118040.1 DoxX family protein [Archangium primigenium]
MSRFFLYLMALLYVLIGITHFVRPDPFVKIMPPFIPFPLAMVYLSGAIEIGLGVLLLPAITRPYAAWGIIALLIAVYPANIQMAVDSYRQQNPQLWVALARLPLQFPLIGWAWTYTRRGR